MQKRFLFGFTLAEVLITLGIAAVVLVAVFPMLHNGKLKFGKRPLRSDSGGIIECFYDENNHLILFQSGKTLSDDPKVTDLGTAASACTVNLPTAPNYKFFLMSSGQDGGGYTTDDNKIGSSLYYTSELTDKTSGTISLNSSFYNNYKNLKQIVKDAWKGIEPLYYTYPVTSLKGSPGSDDTFKYTSTSNSYFSGTCHGGSPNSTATSYFYVPVYAGATVTGTGLNLKVTQSPHDVSFSSEGNTCDGDDGIANENGCLKDYPTNCSAFTTYPTCSGCGGTCYFQFETISYTYQASSINFHYGLKGNNGYKIEKSFNKIGNAQLTLVPSSSMYMSSSIKKGTSTIMETDFYWRLAYSEHSVTTENGITDLLPFPWNNTTKSNILNSSTDTNFSVYLDYETGSKANLGIAHKENANSSFRPGRGGNGGYPLNTQNNAYKVTFSQPGPTKSYTSNHIASGTPACSNGATLTTISSKKYCPATQGKRGAIVISW